MAMNKLQGEAVWEARWDSWKVRAAEKHKSQFQYPSSVRDAEGKIRILCPEHGEFIQAPNKHMHGQRCPKCRGLYLDKVESLRRKFPQWDWLGVTVGGSKDDLLLVCPEHGEFVTRHNRLMNQRDGLSPCPKCNKTAGGASQRVTQEEWERRIADEWGEKYRLVGKTGGTQDLVDFECIDHGVFSSRPNDLMSGHGCPKCAIKTSRGEIEIAEYLEGLGVSVETHNRKILGGFELDIYLPDYKTGIEHCGMYWHGDKVQDDPDYHQKKLEMAEAAGVRLLTVFEDEWIFDTDKVKFRLLNILGVGRTLGGRQTKVESIEWNSAKSFLDEWHMQGAGTPGAIRQGVLVGNELVAVAVWGKSRFEKSENVLELYRLCVKGGVHIRGVVGKVVKALDVPSKVTKLVTYADLRWGTGQGYQSAGFSLVGRTKPGYFWCKGMTRLSRHDFQKHKLQTKLKKYDEELSEVENCRANGYWRVFDCGHAKWEKIL